MTENAIRWAAATQQLAANRAAQRRQLPKTLTDQQRSALQAMSPEQAFLLAYRPMDDDVPRRPEPHHRSIMARQQQADAARFGAAPGWREQLDAIKLDPFRSATPENPEQPWTQAVRLGQQSGILANSDPPDPPPPSPDAAVVPAAAGDSSASPTAGDAAVPRPLPELFAAVEEQLQLAISPLVPSDEATLRRAWRELPGSDREAVARWVEANDYGPGYLSQHDSQDWAAVLVGDSLANRMADARRLQPELSPFDFLSQVLKAAHGRGDAHHDPERQPPPDGRA